MMFSVLSVVLAIFGLRVARAQDDCINILPDPVASLSNDTFNFVAGIVSSIQAPDLSTLANQSATVLDTVLPGASTVGDITMMVGGIIEGASAKFPMIDPANFTMLLTGSVASLQQICIQDIPMEAGMLVQQLIGLIPSQMEVQAGVEAIVAAVSETFYDAASLLSIEKAVESLNMTVTGFGLPGVPELPEALTDEGIMENLQIVEGAIQEFLNQTKAAVQGIVEDFTNFVARATKGLPTIHEASDAIVQSVEDILNQTTEAVQGIVDTTTEFVEDLPYVPEARAAVEEGIETAITSATQTSYAIVDGVQGAINQTSEVVSDIVEDIPTIPEARAAVEERVQGTITQATETGAAVVEGVQDAINQTTEAASYVIDSVSEFVEDVLPPLPEQIPTISEASEMVMESVEDVVQAAGGVLNQTGVTNAVSTLMEGIMEFVSSLGSDSV